MNDCSGKPCIKIIFSVLKNKIDIVDNIVCYRAKLLPFMLLDPRRWTVKINWSGSDLYVG